jgi:hypothetical protein
LSALYALGLVALQSQEAGWLSDKITAVKID